MKADLCSFKEIEHALSDASQKCLAYLPVGCIEQHGPILPLGTDSLIASGIAEDLCEFNSKLGLSGIVYPAVSYTPSRSNICYPGSISVDEGNFRNYLENICSSILTHGFSALVLVCMHGPAEPSLIEIAFRMNQAQIDVDDGFTPLIVSGVSRLKLVFEEILGSALGKHADAKEFLLLYKMLGKDFFTEQRMEQLRQFNDSYNAETVPVTSLTGIPMNRRSVEGVIGSPLPESGSNYDELSDRLWGQVVEFISVEINRALTEADSLCNT